MCTKYHMHEFNELHAIHGSWVVMLVRPAWSTSLQPSSLYRTFRLRWSESFRLPCMLIEGYVGATSEVSAYTKSIDELKDVLQPIWDEEIQDSIIDAELREMNAIMRQS